MKEIQGLDEAFIFARALSSPIRIEILRLLSSHKDCNMNELAALLQVTNGALTTHIKLLADAGLIEIHSSAGKRGIQKVCSIRENKFLVNMSSSSLSANMYKAEIPVGSYVAYQARPTCGIATKDGIIGELDDGRYFDDPKRINAGILWLSKGYVEYKIPNYLQAGKTALELQISFEISSEAPGTCEDWPSDIYFYLNGIFLGYWTSPGDYGQKRGIYTPPWWFSGLNQYGLLKLLSINRDGTFVDGKQIGNHTIGDFSITGTTELFFRIGAPESAEHSGGLTLFGKGFGNYSQGLRIRMVYQ